MAYNVITSLGHISRHCTNLPHNFFLLSSTDVAASGGDPKESDSGKIASFSKGAAPIDLLTEDDAGGMFFH